MLAESSGVSVPYRSRRNVRLIYGKIDGHIGRTYMALRTPWREPFVQRFLCVLTDGLVYRGTAGNSTLQFSCLGTVKQ